ncbi:MAG: thrombospondin type 3 repeat-containing protein [Polyangiales bacterium]
MRRALLALAFASASAASSAEAQGTIPTDGFSTSRFVPAPGADNFLSVDGARVEGNMRHVAGVFLDVAHQPFVLSLCTNPAVDSPCPSRTDVAFVRNSTLVDFTYALVLRDRVQLGVVLPIGGASGEGYAALATPPGGSPRPEQFPGGGSFVLGDIRLSAKVGLLGREHDAFHLAVVGYATLPTAQALAADRAPGQWMGDRLPTIGGHVAAQYELHHVQLAANLGATVRENAELFTTKIGSMLTYRAAAGYAWDRFLFFGEVDGAAGFHGGAVSNPVEGRLGARARFGDFTVNLAAGGGFVPLGGAPSFRFVTGFGYVPIDHDLDGDGLEGDADRCPDQPEDRDGLEDEDGCPDDDVDHDGLRDTEDRCPAQAEDRDDHEDEDGCPDPDDDADGVPDGYDSCPNVPEDRDGDRDDDGCPDLDTDRDGVADSNDRCPRDAEDTDGWGDEDGCPEDDFDSDGVSDTQDECPDQPETRNGFQDSDGCPDEAPARPGRRRRR